MPIFLAFLAGGLFTYAVSNTTKKNTKTANEEFDELLNNRREMIRRVEEILREKGY